MCLKQTFRMVFYIEVGTKIVSRRSGKSAIESSISLFSIDVNSSLNSFK